MGNDAAACTIGPLLKAELLYSSYRPLQPENEARIACLITQVLWFPEENWVCRQHPRSLDDAIFRSRQVRLCMRGNLQSCQQAYIDQGQLLQAMLNDLTDNPVYKLFVLAPAVSIIRLG